MKSQNGGGENRNRKLWKGKLRVIEREKIKRRQNRGGENRN